MSGLAKVFTVLILILGVGFFATTASLFITRVNWRSEFEKYRGTAEAKVAEIGDQLDRALKANNSKDSKIEDLESRGEERGQTLKEVQLEVTTLKNQIAAVQEQANKSNAIAQQLAANLAGEEERNKELQEDIDHTKAALDDAFQARDEALRERDSMKLALVTAHEELHTARTEYQALSERAESDAIALEAAKQKGFEGGASLNAPPIDARVSAVDPATQLAVISAGRDQDVEVGYQLTVARGDSFVAKLQVITVYPDLAGARIIWAKEGEQVRQGDRVFTSFD